MCGMQSSLLFLFSVQGKFVREIQDVIEDDVHDHVGPQKFVNTPLPSSRQVSKHMVST